MARAVCARRRIKLSGLITRRSRARQSVTTTLSTARKHNTAFVMSDRIRISLSRADSMKANPMRRYTDRLGCFVCVSNLEAVCMTTGSAIGVPIRVTVLHAVLYPLYCAVFEV